MSRFFFSVTVFFLLVTLAFRFIFYYSNQTTLKDGQKISFTGRLMTEPETQGSLQRFSFRKEARKIFITTAAFPRYRYGQMLKISGTIKQRLLDNDRIVNTMFFPIVEVKKDQENFLQNLTFHVREKIRSVFQTTLPPVSASLLLGIVFGGKEQLPKAFSDNLASIGLIHIIAASGMNMTMLAGGVFLLLSFFFPRKTAIILSVLALFFYMLLAGFSPSIVRAGIMASLASLASFLGKQYFAVIALGITGYSMLLFDPSVFFDLGFQLSFLSTLGIILLSPLFVFGKKEKYKPVVGF